MPSPRVDHRRASDRTQVVSKPRKYRRLARVQERALQAALVAGVAPRLLGLPDWTRGVRVEAAGDDQYVVVATSRRGH